MIFGLVIILILTLFLPFVIKSVEHNLEIFLFIMGVAAALISNELSLELLEEIFKNHFMYLIVAAVFIAGIIFKFLKSRIKFAMQIIYKKVSVEIVVFFIIVILGFISSIITAIIAALILVEVVTLLPLERKKKIQVNIIACFSIGLGAALTPVGEPISTIIISKMNENFWYIFRLIGEYTVPLIFIFGIIGACLVHSSKAELQKQFYEEALQVEEVEEEETYKEIIVRTLKIFLFVIALELLGKGFKPMIDKYVINLDGRLLYWGNMISAILDNATLASAEISPNMVTEQIKAILMGLLISGGMLIPGNIPNIISANKLKIESGEWVSLGVPLGLICLTVCYVFLFVFRI